MYGSPYAQIVQGLAAATIDTKRARLCTVTSLHIKEGRQAGGEIALWSLRTRELLHSQKQPVAADGQVKNPVKLFHMGHVKSYIGVGSSGFIWAADHISLNPCGGIQAHDRQCLEAVLHKSRCELYCFFADGIIKVYHVSSSVHRDAVKMRNLQCTDFALVNSWPSKVWCETAAVDETLNLLVAAGSS